MFDRYLLVCDYVLTCTCRIYNRLLPTASMIFIPCGINILTMTDSENQKEQSILTQTSESQQIQKFEIFLTDRGYTPKRISVKKGTPVQLIVKNEEARGCIQAFVIPNLNVRKVVRLGEWTTINFTPQKTGKIGFTCSMGMYYGEIDVQ